MNTYEAIDSTDERTSPAPFVFPIILESLQIDNPVSLHWSAQLAEDRQCYILETSESCRVLSVIECSKASSETEWFAQTFRIKFSAHTEDKSTDLHKRYQQIALETADSKADLGRICDLIETLRFGYGSGSELIYLRGYDDEGRRMNWADAHQVRPSEDTVQDDEFVPDNPLVVVEDALLDLEDESAALVTDIARHMTELATVIDVHGITQFVYRSRFDNYSINREVDDLVLIYAPRGDMWYRGNIRRDTELTDELLSSMCDYQKMIIPIEIPAFIYSGIQASVTNTAA